MLHSDAISDTALNTASTHRGYTAQNVSQSSSQSPQNLEQTFLHTSNEVADNQNVASDHEVATYTLTKSQFQPVLRSDNSVMNPTIENVLSLSAMSNNHSQSQVLLATAVVTLFTNSGKPIQARVVFDSGSQTSFITERLVKQLQLPVYNFNVNVIGINQNVSNSNEMIDLKINSKFNKLHTFTVPCAILKTITCNLPQVPININAWKIPSEIELADPTFFKPNAVDILLSASSYAEMLCGEILHLGKGMPVLQKTHLGWILFGSIPTAQFNVKNSLSFFTRTSSSNDNACITETQVENTDALLTRFWELEEISNLPILTPEHELAETIFQNSFKILDDADDGKIQVNLLLKSPEEYLKLGNSYSVALRRFLNLEKRFQQNPELFCKYKNFVHEYVSLNHAERVPFTLSNENDKNRYFMPHHCVIREGSLTTKLRVVFDASSKSSSGYSLNDISLKGFQVQPDLFDILCRFRVGKYAVTIDIEKMYRQIDINPEQRFLQSILWRECPELPLECIQLRTVTYGTTCAPYLATRTLNEIANLNKNKYPLASKILLSQTYMDDLLFSCDSINQVKQICSELNNLLNSYQLKLHKWASNNKSLLESNSSLLSATCKNLQDITGSPTDLNKVLGLCWHSEADIITITTPTIINAKFPLTKRKVLSLLAQTFDPLGLGNPVIVKGKFANAKNLVK